MGIRNLQKYMTDEEELAMLKSKEFNDGLAQRITEETWGKGLPKIIGRSTEVRYEVVALYADGSEKLLAYEKDDISYNLPSVNHDRIRAHWRGLYAPGCYVDGDSEQEIRAELVRRRKELEEIQAEYNSSLDDLDFFD